MLRKDGKEDRRQYNYPMRARCFCGKFVSKVYAKCFDEYFDVYGICKVHGEVRIIDHEFSPEDFGFED